MFKFSNSFRGHRPLDPNKGFTPYIPQEVYEICTLQFHPLKMSKNSDLPVLHPLDPTGASNQDFTVFSQPGLPIGLYAFE